MLENNEIWKDCKGYEGLYQVSSIGRVWSIRSQKTLKTFLRKDGYQAILLTAKNGKQKNELVHRLVALAFLDNPNHLPQVNHKNEIKNDNRVENLEWCDCRYNINYGTRNEKVGRAQGKRVAQYTIGGKFVREFYGTRDAERQLGIDHSTIIKVCQGDAKTAGGYLWRYMDGD